MKNDSHDIHEWFSKLERQTLSWLEDSALRYLELMKEEDQTDCGKVKHKLMKKFRTEDHVQKS